MDTPTTPSRVSTAAPTKVPREFFIDWLRIIALGLLILYHVGMYYVSWGWHIKSPHSAAAAPLLEPLMWLTSPWRMTLLFAVSGMALSLMLARRGAAPGWLGRRARRLLLPLVVGVLLLVPPQSYFEVRQFHGFAGSCLDFLRLYFSATSGFCTPARGCLILPTWNHLWFLPYLFVYTALLALVLRRWPQALEYAAARLPSWLAGWRLLVWPMGWLLLTRATLRPLFGETHALVDDLFLHAQFAAAFALGVVLARCPALWDRFESLRHLALALALLGWALLVVMPPGGPVRTLPWTLVQWCAIVAALGFARRHLGHDSAARRYLSVAVFPVYLLHQTLTIVAAVTLARWGLPPLAEGPLLVVLTLGGGLAGYEVLRRIAWLRPWFGIDEAGRAPVDAEGGVQAAVPGRASAGESPRAAIRAR